MRILCVHNYYGSEAPSGENIAYDAEIALLQKYGHEVLQYTTSSDELRRHRVTGAIRGALSCVWNPYALRRLRRLVRAERPDIMHVHNVFPRLSPEVLCAAAGTPTTVVLTLHNYRLACAAGTATRDGLPCKLCIDAVSVRPALRHRCYRGSVLATLPVAGTIAMHRWLGTLEKNVDAFVALTEFQRQLFVERGLLPEDRVYVRPNFMPGNHVQLPVRERESYVVFAGRMSAEKGPGVLVSAWRAWGPLAPKLVLVGDGPERSRLEREGAAQLRSGQIEFRGQQPTSVTLEIIRRSRLVVVPSMCFEGFPLVIRDAFASGVPVVASNLGALPQIVAGSGAGAVFPVGDERGLQSVLSQLWPDEDRLEQMSLAAAAAYRAGYSEDAAHSRVMEIYAAAMARRVAPMAV